MKPHLRVAKRFGRLCGYVDLVQGGPNDNEVLDKFEDEGDER
jgi:hypothetical protein